MVPVFKNVRERSPAKNYRPSSLLSVVSKVFEKLVNNGIVVSQSLASLLHKLKFYGISDQIFGLISSFLSNRWP